MRNLPAYSFLYYKQLQSLFRLCGQVKTISFESSRYQPPFLANENTLFYLLPFYLCNKYAVLCKYCKSVYLCFPRAYVEFFKSSQSTGVLPEVTLALFLAQHTPPHSMELSVYPTEQIEVLAGNRNVTHLKYARYSFNSHMHVCLSATVLLQFWVSKSPIQDIHKSMHHRLVCTLALSLYVI